MQSTIFKILLFPIAMLYGLGVSIRNFLYKTKVLRSFSFDVPVISVGNLSMGGAGKTPHIEYLIVLLKDYINVGTLSRGYKRKTKGFRIINREDNAELAGDEPLQYKRKYPDIQVAVGENRVYAVPEMLKSKPDLELVLLDDAFQHRAIKPGLNILLTEYSNLYPEDQMLPVGRLREWSSSAERADEIIVTKCPPTMTAEDRHRIEKLLNPLPHQRIYFSFYAYKTTPYYLFNPSMRVELNETLDILLVSGIARTDYLIEYLKTKVRSVRILEYEDHHYFNEAEIGEIENVFNHIDSKNKAILTTEKDAMRLELHHKYLLEKRLPLFALPVEVAFHGNDKTNFDKKIKDWLLDFRA
jgi:tetraacyldisaccharide 4'-kinase